MPEDIIFLDTTLRDGEQTPGVSLVSQEKLLIAESLDDLGVDIIEAGSAATSEGEREGIKAVASAGLKAEICSFVRAVQEDVDMALGCDVDSVSLVVPVSDLHIERKLQKDREYVKAKTVEIIEYAKEHDLVVSLSGEDASRADLEYVKSVYNAGISAGADRLCFCDTVGVLTPEKSSQIFGELSKLGVPVAVHCHDDFGLATANTIAAILAGATEVQVTINGMGERAGNASLEEVVMTLESRYDIRTGIAMDKLYKVSKLVSRLTKVPVASNKPIVGGNVFTHESGIHVHGTLSDKSMYEPISPEIVGRERRIVFGKHTGRAGVEMVMKDLGLAADERQLDEILRRIKEIGDKGARVTDADLQTIAETVLDISSEPKVVLEDIAIVTGKLVTPTASIRLNIEGDEVINAGTGDGPVDAAINALRKAMTGITGVEDIRLVEYHVDAITGGTDALVEVIVKMQKDDKTITARGTHSDIIMASVEAVIEGINRLM